MKKGGRRFAALAIVLLLILGVTDSFVIYAAEEPDVVGQEMSAVEERNENSDIIEEGLDACDGEEIESIESENVDLVQQENGFQEEGSKTEGDVESEDLGEEKTDQLSENRDSIFSYFDAENESEDLLMDEVLINEDAQQTIDDEIPENAQEEKEDTEIDSEGAESLNASYVGESVANPLNVSIGENKSGTISETNSEYFYRFTLSQSGRVTMSAKAQMNYITFKIYDAKGGELWSTTPHWNDTTKLLSSKENVDLTKGTYYFYASRSDIGYGWEDTGNYSFQLSFTSASESFQEDQGGSNNSIYDASSISVDKDYRGQIAVNDKEDFYKFSLKNSGRITLKSTIWMNYITYRVYDAKGVELWSLTPHWNDISQKSTIQQTIDLTKGTYYFYVSRADVGYGWEDTGNFSFQLAYTNALESFAEEGGENNTIDTASSIALDKSYKGQIALNDIEDFYKFTMSSSGRIVLKSTVWMNYISFRIYDTNGNEQWSMRPHWNDTSQKSTVNETIDLTRGTYYFYASRTDVGYGWEDTGNYTFQLSRVKNKQSVSVKMPSTVVVGKSVTIQVSGAIGAVSYKTANTNVAVNKTGKVTGKNAGIAKITVTAAATGNYSAFSKTVSITVLPSGTSISSLKNSAKKKMLVKWKKNSSVSGYEIQYSTSSTFKTGNKATSVTKAATVSKTIGSLVKGKTYYVRIRTYKSVGNKKYYSAWSGKKKINIKK